MIKKKLNTKKQKEIEKQCGQLIHKFIVGGVYHNTLFLIRLDSDDKYKPKICKNFPSLPEYKRFIAGSTEKLQNKIDTILEKKLDQIHSISEIENIIKYVISKAAEVDNSINNRVFIRRLSNNFDLENN